MTEKKKRSKLGSMWDVLVDAVHEPILKHKDKLNIKTAGIVVGKAASLVAKPAVQLYDGVREGYNQKAPTKEEEHGGLR
jgi:hypothetical protein